MTYSAEVLADAPEIYWRLGEASGTAAADSSGNAHPGTYTNTPTLGVTGLVGDADTAVDFAGASNEYVISDQTFTGPGGGDTYAQVTLECVLRVDSLINPWANVWGVYDANVMTLQLQDDDADARLFFFPNSGDDVSAVLALGVTYHVAATYDGTYAYFYVNGALVHRRVCSSGDPVVSGDVFYVGSDAFAEAFDGVVDEAAFYTTALSAARIFAHADAAGLAAAPSPPPDVTPYTAAVLADNPRVYYRLNEPSGTVAFDSSGNDYKGTYVGTVTQGSAGLTVDTDDAITLASAGHVHVPYDAFDPGDSGDWTVEAWINLTDLTIEYFLCASANDDSTTVRVSVTTDGRMRAYRNSGSNVSTDAGIIAAGVPHHVAFVYDDAAATISFYRDGILIDTLAAAGAGTPDPSLYVATEIGARVATSAIATNAFKGVIDEVALYHSALSGERLRAHYLTGAAPPPDAYAVEVAADSPELWWRLGEASGTTAADASGNGHDGTISGTPTLGTTGLLEGDADTAFTFDGTVGDYVKSDDDLGSTTYTTFTLEAVVDIANPPTGSLILGLTDIGYSSAWLTLSVAVVPTPGFDLQWSGASNYSTASGTAPPVIAAGRYHVVATYDGTVATVYVNGAVYDTLSVVADGAVFPSVANLFVADDDAGEPFDGTIDEVAFYTTALSADRVRAHAAAAFLGVSAPTYDGADTAGGTDVAHTLTQTRPATDTAGGTDVAVGLVNSRNAADTAGGTDAAAGTAVVFQHLARNAADTAGGTDVAVNRSPRRTGADTAGGSDVATRVLTIMGPTITVPGIIALTGGTYGAVDAPPGADPVPAVATVPIVTPAGHTTEYLVVSVDKNGQRYADFPDALVTECTWELNAPGEASFSIPIDDPNVSKLPLARTTTVPHREVQIWRNGHLLWWGVPIKRRVNGKVRRWEYTAAGLMWYFTKRYIGDAERGNWVLNPGAELGTANWTAANATFTADTTLHQLGAASFRVAAVGHSTDAYIYQRRTITSTSIGLALVVAGWVYKPAPVGTFTPAIDARGLMLLRINPATGAVEDSHYDVLNDTTEVNKWLRQQSGVSMPPNTTEIIEVRLYTPAYIDPYGGVFWDAIQVVAQESVAFGGPAPDNGPWDQVNIGKEVVRYAQGTGFFAYDSQGVHNGKSDLNIGTAGAASGVILYRIYYLSDHQRIYTGTPGGTGVLDEFPASVNGYDTSIEITPFTRTWTAHYPRKGTLRADLALELGRNISVNYDLTEDITGCANQIVTLGDTSSGGGATPDKTNSSREEGSYNNPASLGGLTLELVESAPTGSPIDTLDQRARARGAQVETAARVVSIEVYEERDSDTDEVVVPLIGVLQTGDVVPVRIVDADVNFDENLRIVRIALDTITEKMRVTVNEEAVGLPT